MYLYVAVVDIWSCHSSTCTCTVPVKSLTIFSLVHTIFFIAATHSPLLSPRDPNPETHTGNKQWDCLCSIPRHNQIPEIGSRCWHNNDTPAIPTLVPTGQGVALSGMQYHPLHTTPVYCCNQTVFKILQALHPLTSSLCLLHTYCEARQPWLLPCTYMYICCTCTACGSSKTPPPTQCFQATGVSLPNSPWYCKASNAARRDDTLIFPFPTHSSEQSYTTSQQTLPLNMTKTCWNQHSCWPFMPSLEQVNSPRQPQGDLSGTGLFKKQTSTSHTTSCTFILWLLKQNSVAEDTRYY